MVCLRRHQFLVEDIERQTLIRGRDRLVAGLGCQSLLGHLRLRGRQLIEDGRSLGELGDDLGWLPVERLCFEPAGDPTPGAVDLHQCREPFELRERPFEGKAPLALGDRRFHRTTPCLEPDDSRLKLPREHSQPRELAAVTGQTFEPLLQGIGRPVQQCQQRGSGLTPSILMEQE